MKSILIALFSLTAFPALATHLVGGEIYYECLGNDEYLVTLKVYRDCGPGNTNNTNFDNTAAVTVYDANNNLITTQNLTYPGPTQVPVIITNPCLQSPPFICIEEAVYSGIFNLPPIPGGYIITYQRCCRNPTIQNLSNPSTYGATYFTRVPGPNEAICNNSAYFANYPPLVICLNDAFYFDHSATDIDGDSLVYSLCDIYHGASQANPSPAFAAPPAYTTVPWAAGYSSAAPIPGAPAISIDPVTGEMTGEPTQQGLFTVGICVQEYRNGVQINQSIRDFLFTVTACQSNIVAEIPGQTSAGSAAAFCSGTTVSLQNNSLNASSYFWDFGDGNTLSDTSSAFEPSYTYTDSGTYTIMLIANPGWPCADTAFTTYELYPAIQVSFPEVPGQCIAGNFFQLQADGNISNNAIVTWDFGPMASPTTSNLFDPEVSFSDTGHYIVTITATENGCTGTYQDTVVVYPPPLVNFSLPSLEGCVPFGVQFQDSSFAWTNIQYLWDFGDGNSSTDQNPYHSYTTAGSYDIVLSIDTDSGCIGSAVSNPATVVVNPRPTAAFYVDPLATSIFEPEIHVINQAFGDTSFYFDLADGTITNAEEFTHAYLDTGHYPVTQIAFNEFGCSDTATTLVWIMPELLFFAPNAFTPNGDGTNEVWLPAVGGVDEYELLIFDRGGRVIWSTTNTKQGWDGIANGGSDMVPIDTYIFQATFKDMVTQMIHIKRGHITVVR